MEKIISVNCNGYEINVVVDTIHDSKRLVHMICGKLGSLIKDGVIADVEFLELNKPTDEDDW